MAEVPVVERRYIRGAALLEDVLVYWVDGHPSPPSSGCALFQGRLLAEDLGGSLPSTAEPVITLDHPPDMYRIEIPLSART